MHEWWIDGETGLPVGTAVKMKQRLAETQRRITELEQENNMLKQLLRIADDGVVVAEALHIAGDTVKPLYPFSLGTSSNYFHDVVSSNITIPSKTSGKTNIVEADLSQLAATPLPAPKHYTRQGRRELWFLAEEMPPLAKTSQGDIDLKALVAVLAAKVMRLERIVSGGGEV
ncbi:MAG: hypothetical protein QXD61_10815 [Candidatus Caldarchaeum sp.]